MVHSEQLHAVFRLVIPSQGTNEDTAKGRWEMFDLDSLNGTVVDGIRSQHSVLKPGTQIVFGAGANLNVGQRWSERPSRLSYVFAEGPVDDQCNVRVKDVDIEHSRRHLPAKRPFQSSANTARPNGSADSKRTRLSPISGTCVRLPSAVDASTAARKQCSAMPHNAGRGGSKDEGLEDAHGLKLVPENQGSHVVRSDKRRRQGDEHAGADAHLAWKSIPSSRQQAEEHLDPPRSGEGAGVEYHRIDPHHLSTGGRQAGPSCEPAARVMRAASGDTSAGLQGGLVETFGEDLFCPICQVRATQRRRRGAEAC